MTTPVCGHRLTTAAAMCPAVTARGSPSATAPIAAAIVVRVVASRIISANDSTPPLLMTPLFISTAT